MSKDKPEATLTRDTNLKMSPEKSTKYPGKSSTPLFPKIQTI